MFVVGGYNGVAQVENTTSYSPATGLWTQEHGGYRGSSGFSPTNGAHLYGPDILVPGFADNFGQYNSELVRFNTQSRTWLSVGPTPLTGGCGTSAIIGTKLYVLLNCDNGASAREFRTYDLPSGTWDPLPLPLPPNVRDGTAAVALGGRFYLVGGVDWTSVTYLGTTEYYDPASRTWTLAASMNFPRAYVSLAASPGRLHAVGGYANGRAQEVYETYDPVANVWVRKPDLANPRHSIATAVVGTTLLAAGGTFYSNAVTSVLESYNVATTGAACDPSEPDGEPARATRMEATAGTSLSYGRICSSTDRDHYGLLNSSATAITLQVEMTPPASRNYDLYVVDAAGAVLASSRNTGAQTEALTIVLAPGSAVYARIQGVASAFDTGRSYTLRLVAPATGFLHFPLSFPIPSGYPFAGQPTDPYSTRITSIFDNSRSSQPNGIVRAYNGEQASVVGSLCDGVRGYRKASGGSFALPLLTYDGGCSLLQSELFYDEHSGYDYSYPDIAGRSIFSAAGGTLCVAELRTTPDGVNLWRDRAKCAIQGGLVGQWALYHTMWMKHSNGYSTWYLHAEALEPVIHAQIVAQGYATIPSHGYGLGFVGGCCANPNAPSGYAAHLHFGVRDPNNTLVDPYGNSDVNFSKLLWVQRR